MGFDSKEGTEFTIRIVGSGDATKFVEAVNNAIDGTGKKTGEADKKAATLTSTFKSMADAVKKADFSAGGLASALSPAIGAAVGLGKALFDAYEGAIRKQAEYSKKLALAETVERRMGEGFGAALREATGGQVFGDAERAINRASMAAQQAGMDRIKILEAVQLATKLANQSGTDVAETIDDVMTALTTGRTRALATSYGIIVDQKNAEDALTGAVGEGNNALEKRQKIAAAGADVVVQLKKITEVQTESAKASAALNKELADIERTKAKSSKWAAEIYGILFPPVDPMELARTRAESEWTGFLSEQMDKIKDYAKERDDLAGGVPGQIAQQKLLSESVQAQIAQWEKAHKVKLSAKDAEIAETLALAGTASALGDATNAAMLYAAAQGMMTDKSKVATQSLHDQAQASYDLATAQILEAEIAAQLVGDVGYMNRAQALRESLGRSASGVATERAADAGKPKTNGGGGGGGGGMATSADVWPTRSGADLMNADPLAGYYETKAREEQVKLEGILLEIEQIKKESERIKAATQALAEASAAQGQASITTSLQALGEAGGPQLAQSLAIGQTAIESFIDTMRLGEAAGLDFSGQIAASTPGAITAIGQLGAAWASSASTKYAILGTAELAAGIAASFINPAEATSHYIASGTYFLASGMAASAGGGGGGGGASPSTRKTAAPAGFGASKDSGESKPTMITVSLEGANLFADDPKVYQKLGLGIQKHLTKWGK